MRFNLPPFKNRQNKKSAGKCCHNRFPNALSSPRSILKFTIRKGFWLMIQSLWNIKYRNGGCFGFVPNFLFLLSIQLFNPHWIINKRYQLPLASSFSDFLRAAIFARFARICFSLFFCSFPSTRGGFISAASRALGHGPRKAFIATTSLSEKSERWG